MAEEKRENTQTGLEIAVIGMAGRFPGAANIEEFRENLENGVESVTFYSDDELKAAGIGPDLLENPDYVGSGGGLLDDADCFDASFFGYLPAGDIHFGKTKSSQFLLRQVDAPFLPVFANIP